MPSWLAVALVVLVVLGFVVRRLTRTHRLARDAGSSIGRLSAALALVGAAGLALHCTAMFYPRLVNALPGGTTYATIVNRMGAGSVALFVVPAALVLIGLRRQRRLATVVLALVLLAVGVTMYDGGPLPVHLAAITASVAVLASIVAFGASSDSRRVRDVRQAR